MLSADVIGEHHRRQHHLASNHQATHEGERHEMCPRVQQLQQTHAEREHRCRENVNVAVTDPTIIGQPSWQ